MFAGRSRTGPFHSVAFGGRLQRHIRVDVTETAVDKGRGAGVGISKVAGRNRASQRFARNLVRAGLSKSTLGGVVITVRHGLEGGLSDVRVSARGPVVRNISWF